MKISTLFYTIRQGFVNIFRNKWYSLASVATIAACLFLFGLFYSIVMNFRSIVLKAEEGVSVTVFFHYENDWCDSHVEGQIPSDARIEEIGQLIASRAEVSDVKFISDDEAWENYRRDNWGENYEAYSKAFLENPLEGDDSYEVFISDVSLQSALVTWLESLPEVMKVNHSALTADTLSGANLLIAYVSVGIIVILLAVSIFLISNTVAIGISVRSEEINIMKYIGATDFFAAARTAQCLPQGGHRAFPMDVLPPLLLKQGLNGLEGLAADQDGVSVSAGVSLVSEGQGYLELCPRRTVRAVLDALGVQDVRYFPLKLPL